MYSKNEIKQIFSAFKDENQTQLAKVTKNVKETDKGLHISMLQNKKNIEMLG